MVGLIVSVLVAAVISTLDSGLNSFSTIFTLDIYKRWMAPTATEHQIKQVGRLATIASALLAVWIALFLSKAEGTNLFNLFQGIIGYMAPPVSAVFVLGIFWKRSTATAALLTLIIGSSVSLLIGFCDITNVFANEAGEDIFPHFLLLSFYLFCGILIFMAAVSLLTQHSLSETPLPSLAQTYRDKPGLGPVGLAGWALLAVIMAGLYLFFQFGMKAE
jgi:SSS family solute:Na+ symporter